MYMTNDNDFSVGFSNAYFKNTGLNWVKNDIDIWV